MPGIESAVLALYYLTLAALAVFSGHRLYLVRLRRRTEPLAPPPAPHRWPSVTIQLPLFNEPNVAARLIDASAAIRYPGGLEIQVLDDSTDETPDIVAERVSTLRERGVAIEHIRREHRSGYKAGALADGLTRSRSELFAVFDADFLPQPDVLLTIVPFFADPAIGMVQARWEHLNREDSMLTRVQAILLDAHFTVESAARNFGGCFFNFNGTAGVWRREAIEQAGGWSSSTLTEDLDLSYRSQLAGWKFIFVPGVAVPGELPELLSGFQEQQHRWAKGSVQTARKVLPSILRSAQPCRVKVEALFHLSNNSAYVLSLLLAVLIVPALMIRHRDGISPLLFIDAAFFALSTGSILRFYVEGQRQVGRPVRIRELLAVMPVGIGMAVRNANAVMQGLMLNGGVFARTPKRGNAVRYRRDGRPRIPWLETLLVLYLAGAGTAFVAGRFWSGLPFLALLSTGYGWVAFQAWRERIWTQSQGSGLRAQGSEKVGAPD